MSIFFFVYVVRFHTALFASEPETKQKHIPFIGSSIHLYYSLFRSRPRPHLYNWDSVSHPSAIVVFTPAQKIRTKGGSELEFDSIEPNKTGVNAPIGWTWGGNNQITKMADYNGSSVALENIVICLEQGKNQILSAIMKADFPHVCNVPTLLTNALNQTQKGLYAHKIFPMRSNSFAFKCSDVM